MNTTVIAVSGHAQNGKDTCAKFLKEAFETRGYKTRIIHYADLLKFICKNYFDWDGNKDDAGRTLLQRVGTDVVRKKNPDFWVDFVFQLLNLFPDEWDFVIIPDTRFPNEVNGGQYRNEIPIEHMRVIRTTENFVSPLTEEQQKHPSETALDNVEPDFTIYNSDLDTTRNRIASYADYLITKYKN